VWSLTQACWVYRFLTGNHLPFELERDPWVNAYAKCKAHLVVRDDESLSAEEQAFLLMCLAPEPAARASLTQVAAHEFVSGAEAAALAYVAAQEAADAEAAAEAEAVAEPSSEAEADFEGEAEAVSA